MKRVLYGGGLALLCLIAAIFAASNDKSVGIGIWPMPDMVSVPIGVAVLVALVLGYLAGLISGWLRRSTLRARQRRLTRHVSTLEAELATARAEAKSAPQGRSLALT